MSAKQPTPKPPGLQKPEPPPAPPSAPGHDRDIVLASMKWLRERYVFAKPGDDDEMYDAEITAEDIERLADEFLAERRVEAERLARKKARGGNWE